MEMIYSLIPIVSMAVGFYFGYRIGKDKEIPKIEIKTPVEVFEEHQERREQKRMSNELDIYMSNIDNYPNNQREVK